MSRKPKPQIDDEELDRQSFPPPPYDSVYPDGPPKRFSVFSIESTQTINTQSSLSQQAEEDETTTPIITEEPTTLPTTTTSINSVIRNQPQRHQTSTRSTSRRQPSNQRNSRRYRQTLSVREDDQICCCFSCCALCCGQCLSVFKKS